MTTLRIVFLLLTLLAVACNGATATPQIVTVVVNRAPVEADLQVQQTDATYDEPVPISEPVIISNCGGAELPGQEIRRRSTVNIEGEASLGVGYGIIEGKVLAHYGAEQQTEVTQTLPTIQNMKMIYHITWYENVFTGFISSGHTDRRGSYLIRLPTHADVDITYIDCTYENFIRAIEPPIHDERALEAIQLGLENQDLAGARRRLAEAGYPDGISVVFLLSRFRQMGSSIESAEIQILVEKLAKIGVQAQPIPPD